MDVFSKIVFAEKFSRKPKLSFKVKPMTMQKNEYDNYMRVPCDTSEATSYSVFCTVQDGDLLVDEWIADFDGFSDASMFRDLICNLCGMENCKVLTASLLEKMQPGEIIASGKCFHKQLHVGLLHWVGVRGMGMNDWAIYYYMWGIDERWIVDNGEKITSEQIVRGLIPCDSSAWELYRR